MGTQRTGSTLTPGEVIEQARHDLRHPGKVCQHCPIESARRREFDQRRADYARRERWRMRWLPWIAGAILVGCWLLGSWLLGPS